MNKKIKKTLTLSLVLMLITHDGMASVTINAGASIVVNGSPMVTTNGDWTNSGTFTAGTGMVILNGGASVTVNPGASMFYDLTINKTAGADADDNVTIATNDLTVDGTTTISDGELIQGATNFALKGITVAAAGKYSNSSTGDLTLSGAVANAGTIAFDAGGGGGGGADSILIRSSVNGTQRNWQGAGTFSMTDVDVKDQTAIGGTPASIFVSSGTNSLNNVNWFFGGGTLTLVNIEPASLQAGAEGDATASFTLENLLPVNGKVVIDFGAGFNAAGLTAITNLLGIDGGWTVTLSNGDGTNDVVTLTRDGTGTATPAGTAVSIRLEDEVRNPLVGGSTGIYTVTTQLNAGTAIDTGTAAADTISGGVLSTATVTPAALIVGALVTNTVGFTTATDLPVNGKIKITFPAGFDLTNLTSAASTDIDGTLTVSVSGQTVTITRSGGSILAGGSVIDDLVLGQIRNPKSPGISGTFAISTTNAADGLLDSGTAPGVTITAAGDLISLTLEVSKERVKVGDLLTFRAVIKNLTAVRLQDFKLVNQLPAGLMFRPGTEQAESGTFIPASSAAEPVFTDISVLEGNASRSFTFQAVVGSAASNGSFNVSAYVEINPIISNTALVTVQIVPDFIFQVGTLIGKVFWDKNGDGIQQKGEPGIPDARVATEEGVVVTTDAYGRYHVPDVKPGRHLVKLDRSSLPDGTELTTQNSLLIHSTDAMLNKANFGVKLDAASAGALKLGGSSEPVTVTVRRSSAPPATNMNLDFNTLAEKPDEFPLLGTLGAGKDLLIPLNPQTNFPLFIKKWSVELFEVQPGGSQKHSGALPAVTLPGFKSDERRVQIALIDGKGAPPNHAALKAPEEKIMSPQHGPLELEFTVYDEKGKKDVAVFGLQTRQTPDSLDLILSGPIRQEKEISVSGTGVILDGESPLTHRVEIFGNPVPVSKSMAYHAEFILPEGDHVIPIDVYPGGLDPVKGIILPVKPIRLTRAFKASDNYFFHVGMGDLEMGHLTYKGSRNSLSDQDKDRLENYLYSDHRFAYYLKGKFRGKYYLTASIDTDRERKELFRNLEPEDYYATYGDESKIEYDAADTQDEVFAMLEADKSYLRYGNFATGFTGTEFANFSRTLHGFKAHYESVKTDQEGQAKNLVSVFGAKARQLAAHAEYRATGGSLYYMKHRVVTMGSEKISTEVRDKITGITIAKTSLVAGIDYDIDYSAGRIRLYRPLRSVTYSSDSILSTELLQGNPQYLIVDYEYDGGEVHTDKTIGARASREWLPGLRLGGTYVEEQRSLEDYHLAGTDASYKFRDIFDVRAEYARSDLESTRQFISDNGGITFAQAATAAAGTEGTGYKVETSLRPWKGMRTEAFYRNLDRDFSNTGSLSQAGARKYGMLAEQLLGTWGSLNFQHYRENLLDDGTIASSAADVESANITQIEGRATKGKWTGLTAYRHGRIAVATTAAPSILPSLAAAQENFAVPKEDEELVGAEVRYALTPKTELGLGAQTSLRGEENNQLKTTVTQKLNELSTIFASHVIGSRGNGVLAGIDAPLTGRRVHGLGSQGKYAAAQDSLGGQGSGQESTLGFIRQLGPDTQVIAGQSAGTQGLGRQVLSITKQNENQSYALIQEKSAYEDITTVSQERRVNEHVTTYSNSSINRNRLTHASANVLVRGVRANYLDNRVSLYKEDETAAYLDETGKASRSGAGLLLTPEFGVDVSYEKGQTHTALVDTGHHAGRTQLTYMKFNRAKVTGDFEFRRENAQTDIFQLLSTGQGEFKINPDWTGLGRWEWSRTRDITDTKEPVALAGYSEYQFGFAYRPVKMDWLNLLLEYKKLAEKSPGGQSALDTISSEISRVYRGEAAIDLNRYFTVVEKFALRRASTLDSAAGSSEIDSTTALWANRLNVHLLKRVDLALEYRILRQSLAQDSRQGLLAEITLRVFDGMRVGIGYNFMDYDARLARALDLETAGIYVRLIYEPLETAERLTKKNQWTRNKLNRFFSKEPKKNSSSKQP